MIVLIYYLWIRRKKKLFFILIKIREAWEDTKVAEQKKSNILEEGVQGHRFGKKLTNNDYGTVAFLLSRNDILPNKDKNAESFSDIELTYNCIYFLIGYEQNSNSITEMMYVGQAGIRENNQSVLDRLNEHAWKGTDPAKYIDKWTDIVVVTNEKKAWGATELDALEHIFWSLIPVGNRYNSIKPSCTGADLSKFTEAVKQIKEYLDYLQFTMFKEKTDAVLTQNISDIARAKSEIPVDLDRGTTRIPNITTPPRIVAKMLELLPSEIWNDETKFLDPACKDGGFLRAIYDKLVKDPKLIAKYNGNVDSLKNKILSNLYGIALNQNSKAVTIKNLNGFRYNVTVVTNYVNKLRENKLADIIKEEFGEDMTFDVVIGNPPYQESTGSGLNESGGTALFDSFIINGVLTTNRLLCMITPTKWLAGNMKTFVKVRHTLLDEGHLRKMVDYMNAKDIFNGRSIAGGVSYFLYDKQYKGDTDFTTINNQAYNETRKLSANDIVPRHYIGDTVIDKVRQKSTDYISDYIYKNLWGLGTDYDGNPIRTNDNEVEVITPRGYSYAEFDYRPKYCDTYKVAFTRVVPDHAVEPDKTFKYRILSSLQVLKPGQICNASYMAVCNINKEEYANNIKGYLETKFVRFLVLQTLFGIGLTPDRFQFVPMQNFKEAWTDEKLYSKYNLSADEIVFIEKIMAPLNNNGSAKATVPAIIKNNVAPSAPKLTAQDAMANYINKRVQSEQE